MTFGVNALDWTSVTQKMAETFRNEETTSETVFEPDYLIMTGEDDATGTPVKLVASIDNDDISQWWQVENSAGETTFYWVVPKQTDWTEEEFQTYFSELPEDFTYSITAKVYPADVELPIDTAEKRDLKEAEVALLSSTSLSSVPSSVALDEVLNSLQTAYNDLLSGEEEEEEEEEEGEDETTTDDSTGGLLDGILDKLSSSMESLKTYAVPAVGVVAAVGIVGFVWTRGSQKSKDKTTIGELLGANLDEVDIKDD